MPTQTTVEGDALLGTAVDVDDCTLRMLAVAEIQDGMAFHRRFKLLGKAKRDKVRMLGNAVTPPAARDLAACVFEAITGVDLDLTPSPPSPTVGGDRHRPAATDVSPQTVRRLLQRMRAEDDVAK